MLRPVVLPGFLMIKTKKINTDSEAAMMSQVQRASVVRQAQLSGLYRSMKLRLCIQTKLNASLTFSSYGDVYLVGRETNFLDNGINMAEKLNSIVSLVTEF